ncbi:12943_t:CDS:2 [Cetraspora pellucida]|uniref:12943_t:CDS:1 n=1 Tax=Cetraspora pellucida TaxID=1433469 RepID=A0A9N9B0S9_9GLOM|nr:12943_t:CDS:2 [Cetraspora pellucida]
MSLFHTSSGRIPNNQQEIYEDLPPSYDESQALVVEQVETITEEKQPTCQKD